MADEPNATSGREERMHCNPAMPARVPKICSALIWLGEPCAFASLREPPVSNE